MAKNISQASLRNYLRKQQRIEKLQAEVKAVEEQIFDALKSGAAVQDGLLFARIKEWERRSVSWREVCEREIGVEKVQRIFNATKPAKHEKLEVGLG